jgi:hypothetical protein
MNNIASFLNWTRRSKRSIQCYMGHVCVPVSIRKSARGVHGIISSSASITIRATTSTSSVTRGSGVIVDSATQTCFGFQRGFHSLFFHGLSFFGAPCFFGLLPQSCRFLLLRRTNPAHILLQGRDTSWIMNDPQRCPLPSTFHPRIQHCYSIYDSICTTIHK